MDELAIFGGPPAMQISAPKASALSQRAIDALREAAERARTDWSYVSALSGTGPVAALEAAVSEFVQARYGLAVSSGTAALFLALAAAGVKQGDEVIVPAYSWPHTVAPVLHLGAKPVFADSDPRRYTLSPPSVRERLTDRTVAMVAVHIYGQPADMPALTVIARERGITLIEDAAQAFGARLNGRPVGSWGDVGCFSLGRDKPVSGGEGGLFVTSSRPFFERAVALSQHPIRRRFETTIRGALGDFGYNFRIHPLACVIARAEMEDAQARQRVRADYWVRLSDALAHVPGVRPPEVAINCDHAFWRYCPTFVPEELADGKLSRSAFIEALAAEGVPVYPDPVATSLEQRLRGCAHPVCRNAAERCRRTGLALAPWIAERPDTISALRSAVEKVAAAAERLEETERRRARHVPLMSRSSCRRDGITTSVGIESTEGTPLRTLAGSGR